MATDINAIIAQAKNSALQTQGMSKAAQIKAQGGSVKHGGPSILSRIFDVISRPLYATAEPVARTFEGKSAGSIAKGVLSGLAGKSKTDYNQVIERGAKYNNILDAINKNKYAKFITGTTANVVLDPSTYFGGELVRAGGEQAAKAAGLRAIGEHMALPETVKAIREAGDTAKLAKLERATTAGADAEKAAKGAERAGKAAARAADREALNTAKETVGKAAYEAAKTNAPGKIGIKFAGKSIAQFEKPYAGLAKLGNIVGSTEVGNSLNKAFRTAATFPENTNKLRREVQLAGLAHAEEVNKEIANFYKDLKPHELQLVTHAAEAGKAEGGLASSLHGVLAENGKDLGPYVDKMRNVLDTNFNDAYNAGVFRDAKGNILPKDQAYKENYVPHYYEKGMTEEEAVRKGSKVVGPDKPNFTKQQAIESVAHAKSLGLPVEENADRILMKRTSANYQAIARAKYVDGVTKEYGKEFGRKLSKKFMEENNIKNVDSPYVSKTTYFPAKIADAITALEEMHTNNKLYEDFLKHFDAVQNHWKFAATGVNPGHHFRNMIGDAWNNFVLGGVKNPDRYRQSAEVVLRDSPNFTMKVGEATLDKADLLRHNIESGAKPSFTSELTGGDPGFLKGLKGKIAAASEKREEFTRMAHFIDAFKDEGKAIKANSPTLAKDLQEAASRAGARVRHVNIDFGDLTHFEQQVMKRAIPFYTWSRKNLPLQLEALALHPGRVAALPKGTAALQTLLGTNQGGYNSQGVMDTIPKWLKQMSSVRLQGEGHGKNSIYWNTALPFDDISKFTEGGTAGVFSNLVGMLSPGAKIPIELATGKSLFTGGKRQAGAAYAAGQVPSVNQIYKLLSGKQKLASPQTLNYLSGAGIQEITPGQVASENYRQQADLNKTLKALRNKAKAGK